MGITGEQLLATTGIDAALEPGPLKVTKKQLVAAVKLPQRAKERLAEAIAQDKPGKDQGLRPFDYDRMLELLPPPVTEERLAENVAGWPDQVLANEYAGALGRAWGYLQSQFPIETRDHLSGIENVRPPEVRVTRFRRLLEVVENPLSIIDRLASGELLSAEVEALKTAYPELCALLQQLATEALIDYTAEKRQGDKEWHLPMRKDKVLRRLLEMPTGSVQQRTQQSTQAIYEEQRQQGEKQVPDAPAGKPPKTDTELTHNQAVELD